MEITRTLSADKSLSQVAMHYVHCNYGTRIKPEAEVIPNDWRCPAAPMQSCSPLPPQHREGQGF